MWRKLVIGFVFVVATLSVLIGLTWPDGSAGGKVATSPASSPDTTTPTPTPAPEPGEVSPVKTSSAVPLPGLPDRRRRLLDGLGQLV